ncbi:hypothetical protein QTO34_004688 [Cnephaeus nilssonii]|uniref:Peptidase A2 domain-containing protein n=1 Tax=Cnephaeus nilssonii TaxID=3371016 RepID=A0AA40HPT4_CNENI|nr:hypothetical protein QTO34_004688 [Eptesicus nilssonii]
MPPHLRAAHSLAATIFVVEKAISRAGLQHLTPAHPLGLPVANGPAKEPRATLDWSENAVNGEHLWLETNVSGDLCYLGEENCQVRFAEPRVTLQVGGKPVSFLVDTGAAYSVLTEPMGPVTSKKTSVQGATGQIACFP